MSRMTEQQIQDYIGQVSGYDADVIAGMIEKTTAPNAGSVYRLNASVMGQDVLEDITKLAILLKVYNDKIGGEAAEDAASVRQIYEDIIEKTYIPIELTARVFDETAIVPSAGENWVSNYSNCKTSMYTVPEYGFLTLTANRSGIKYGYSDDNDGVTKLSDYGVTEDVSASLYPSGDYAYLYVMSNGSGVDYGVTVTNMVTLKELLDMYGVDIEEIGNAIDDINAIKDDYYRDVYMAPVVLDDTWIYQSSGAWRVGRSSATTGYTVYRYRVTNGKSYRLISSNTGTRYGFSASASGAEIVLHDYSTAAKTNESITAADNYLFVAAISPTLDRQINLYEISSLRDTVESISTGGFGTKIFVAASNATASEKQMADFVCDGRDDGAEINAALGRLDNVSGSVILSSGTFYLDTLRVKNGKHYLVSLFNDDATGYKQIEGQGAFWMAGGTLIRVTTDVCDALDELDEYDECKVFGSTKTASTSCYGLFEKFRVWLPDNKHKIVCIDNAMFNGGKCNEIVMEIKPGGVTLDTSDSDNIPVEGCVGIRGYDGHNHGCINEFNQCFGTGFYEAFQLGGEHLICRNLGARYNYYSYTFGHYTWTHGKASSTDSGTQTHPITLINCAEEGAVNLPKFFKCGQAYYLTPGHEKVHLAKQEVNFIDFTIEFVRSYGQSSVGLATEEYPGAFCGKIDFTMNGSTASFEKTGNVNTKYASDYGVNDADVIPAGSYGNHTNAKFWADGMGHNFVTRNMTHKQGGGTAERLSYEPNYMQTYYDTDLQKMMLYDGTDWVEI